MHQHPLAGADVSDAEQQVIGGEVVERDRGSLFKTLTVRDLEHLLRRHAHHICVPAEMREGEHPPAHRVAFGALAKRVDYTRRLVADHARRAGGCSPSRISAGTWTCSKTGSRSTG